MKWVKHSTVHAVSECGRYEMRGMWTKHGNFWNAFDALTGQLLFAGHDKGVLKDLCDRHSRKEAA